MLYTRRKLLILLSKFNYPLILFVHWQLTGSQEVRGSIHLDSTKFNFIRNEKKASL